MTTRTVIGQYLNIDNTPVKGYLEFTPTSTVAQGYIIPVSTVRVALDDTGSFSVDLPVTDNPIAVPVGWKWSLEEKIPNGNHWYFDLPTSGTPLNLASVVVISDDSIPVYGVAGPIGPQGPVGPVNTSSVAKAGDTMTGPLVLPGDPTLALQAATKQYADTKLSKSGGTMTGIIVPAHTAAVEFTSVSWNSLVTNGRYANLMHAVNNPNGPGIGDYYHVEVFVYSSSGNVTQVGYPYSADTPGGIVYRSRYSGVWTEWHFTGNSKSDISFAAGFSAYPGYSPCRVTRQGGIVVMEGLINHDGTVAYSAGAHYTMGYVPVGYRPGIRILTTARYSGGNDSTRLDIQTDGTITFCPPVATTLTPGAWISITASWRVA